MSKRKIYEVQVKTKSGDYQGTFYSPFPDKRLSEAVSKLEGYLNLKDVTLIQTGEKYPFVIINKNSVEMIILVEEKEEP
jgi:hypothetical protein